MKALTFEETEKLLEKYNIPFAKTKLCKSKKEAASFAKRIGFPLALKIVSPDILHKTDIGGVKLMIMNEKDLKQAWNEILVSFKKQKPKVQIKGILVQEMIAGKEVVIGMKRDKSFGPVLMFGLGGIFIELFKDTVFRVAPATKKEARKMIKELKGFAILKGARGQKPVDIEKIVQIIVKVSKLSLTEKNIKEIDLNPIIVNEKEASVVDAKFLV